MNVLFVSHRLPYAPNRGDRVRAYHLLREISQWADVDVVALTHDEEEASHAPELASFVRSARVVRVPKLRNLLRAAMAVPTSLPATHAMLHAPGLKKTIEEAVARRRPDVVFSYCTGIAPFMFFPAVAHVPAVLDMVDVDSEKWKALSATSGSIKSWIYSREARTLRRFEVDATRRAGTTLVVNERERDSLRQIHDGRIVVIENGVDASSLVPTMPPTEERVVVFCGVMNYAPNVEGAVWLASKVWPIVRQNCPDAQLLLVGSHPARAVSALANSSQGIVVTGEVPDVRPYLWKAAVSAAPVHTARGVQNKVLEAVAAGLPAIVTPAVMNGLPNEVHQACVSASTDEDFAAALVNWLGKTGPERRAKAALADLAALTWDRRLSPLRRVLTDVAAGGLASSS